MVVQEVAAIAQQAVTRQKKEIRCRVCGRLLHSSCSRHAGVCSRCEKGGFVSMLKSKGQGNGKVLRWTSK